MAFRRRRTSSCWAKFMINDMAIEQEAVCKNYLELIDQHCDGKERIVLRLILHVVQTSSSVWRGGSVIEFS